MGPSRQGGPLSLPDEAGADRPPRHAYQTNPGRGLTPSRLGTGRPHALRMRPSACSARRAGLRIASATDLGRNRRTDRHAEVATRSNPVGVDDCAVLIDRSPQCSQAVPARGGW
jgi:hypothetical protein